MGCPKVTDYVKWTKFTVFTENTQEYLSYNIIQMDCPNIILVVQNDLKTQFNLPFGVLNLLGLERLDAGLLVISGSAANNSN